ncbi:MAG: YdcF family protein [Bacteroidales bacterium]|nr:YdcF family protein [Bacteroidales bacterium]MCF8402694.1 YdcF family protein [Bacteroidales bacterium]
MFKKVSKVLLGFVKILVITFGIIFLLMIVLSFTDRPYMAYHWLGTHNSEITETPDYLVVMGAGGMPGPEGLMRCYFAAKGAERFPESKIIIALPSDTLDNENSDSYRMFEEIAERGINKSRFIFETKGTNTYYQALEINKLLLNQNNKNLLIVTSPEHMYRCILTFKKLGFEHVSGLPSFENAFDDSLLFTKEERSQKIKDLNRSLDVRYNMWNYLRYEIIVIREWLAISWYKFKGYI